MLLLSGITEDTETHDVKSLQKQDTYCKHIHKSLHIPMLKNKFTIKPDTLYKIIEDSDKSFKALIVSKSLAFTILTN